jgi:branched-chain amino acid transport system permease protein
VLSRTVLGKALRACAENPVAASLMGIEVQRMSLLAFGAGALIGALGGVVSAPLISVSFNSGNYFTNAGFIALALGGMGSLFGGVVGGLVLGLLQQLAAGYVSSLFSTSIAFVLLLILLVARPSGILGRAPAREDTAGPHADAAARSLFRLRRRTGWLAGALGALVVLALPAWLEPNGLTASFVIIGLLFIAVLGLDLLMGYAGQVSLGQAGFMAIGAYGAGVLSTRYHLAPLLGVLVGLLGSLGVALVVSVITSRLRGLYLALATLAFGLLVDSLTVGLTTLTGGPSGLVGIPNFSVGSYAFATPLQYYYLVWCLAGVLLLVAANLARSDYGRALQAIRGDQTAARALGIAVPMYKGSVFLLSAAFASLAGSLYAFEFHFISPELVSTDRSIEMVTMLVIGGQGSLVGPVLGVLVLTLLPTLSQAFAQYKTLAEGLLLVVILLYVPGGLVGGLAAALGRVARGPSRRVKLAETSDA